MVAAALARFGERDVGGLQQLVFGVRGVRKARHAHRHREAEVASTAYPDASQWDPEGPYFDAKVRQGEPRWLNVDVRLVRKTRLLSLAEMRETPALASLLILKRGNRLSITPVTADEWRAVQALLSR